MHRKDVSRFLWEAFISDIGGEKSANLITHYVIRATALMGASDAFPSHWEELSDDIKNLRNAEGEILELPKDKEENLRGAITEFVVYTKVWRRYFKDYFEPPDRDSIKYISNLPSPEDNFS